MTTTNQLQVIKDRFDVVSEKILNHPNFDDEGRELATFHAATYMATLKQIIESSNGVLPEDSELGLGDVIEFLDLVDSFCADKPQA